jgi:peroxiredoxin
MKESFYGIQFKDYAKLCVGQPFPGFTLPTADGKTLALSEIIGKSKITLVHFWGSDSYIKKQMQDELRVLYNKYHGKGLNIVGFYTDKYGDQWKDLVQKEQYPWYNVSDLKGREGMAATVYHEYIALGQTIANTTNVLIDDKGKILAWDVLGAEMEWYVLNACNH